jgi:hypothetical protein
MISRLLKLKRRQGVSIKTRRREPYRFTALGRRHYRESKTVRHKGIAVRTANIIATASDRIYEIPILSPDRVAVRRSYRATATDVNHDLMVVELDREFIRENVKPDTMAPAQQTGRGHVG